MGIIQAFWEQNIQLIGYSEIDKFSSAILEHRFPWVKNYGNIKLIDIEELSDFDVLVGGSPCQDLSISKTGRQGLMGSQSGLFFEYVRILRTKRPAFFVLENVASMKNDDRDFISETLGVEPIKINSSLLTAQNRNRYYWTNIPNVQEPKDKGILLKDTLENGVAKKYYVDWERRDGRRITIKGDELAPDALVEVRTDLWKEQRDRNKKIFGIDRNKRNKDTIEYVPAGTYKANCLMGAIRHINLLVVENKGIFGPNKITVRMPTPIECERLQGFPDNWTLIPWWDRMMSDTQRYKQTGNAVTVNVIQHIFEALKKHLIETSQPLQSSDLYCWLPTQKKVKKSTNVKQYVAYYTSNPKKGLNINTQKAIVHHFTKQDKAIIAHEFTESSNWKRTVLDEAIKYCQKSSATLIIAKLNVLSLDVDLIFNVKKKLGDMFKSCDLPTSDRLTMAVAIELEKRKIELHSIKVKTAFRIKKAKGQTFGNSKNLTAEGRKLGLAKIKENALNNSQNKRLLKIVAKCKASNMSYGIIANELNQNGFTTTRGKQFHRTTVKRLYELKKLI